ncbi:MAG: hypothetical protein DM484_08640 [Candidatus Methylumidiphilus alinenensis]|uniref:Uncharacterized protein n=1 Tax=Candidatus Methylumidiphilus alinenensis TaxID=2202197 RepID=A0A2W4RDS6_9GAMM|nr:MAG: hypothetical protein DM484_08640 [Candidatus Methylumidiphilus alinenensis]
MYQPADLHPCNLDSGNPCRNDGFSALVLVGSQAPVWKALSCKLLLGSSSGSWSLKTPIPKRKLGNKNQLEISEK